MVRAPTWQLFLIVVVVFLFVFVVVILVFRRPALISSVHSYQPILQVRRLADICQYKYMK